jgi:DNA-binding PadR family transcriptional regulator
MEPLPLTEPVLLVLLSLAEQPRHGYSILKEVERMRHLTKLAALRIARKEA